MRDAWVEEAKVVANDGMVLAEFGSSVVAHEDVIVVGAPGDSRTGLLAGAAYVYSFRNGIWAFDRKLVPHDAFFLDAFGHTVDVIGTAIVIGAAGTRRKPSVYVFRHDRGSWVEAVKVPDTGPAVAIEQGVFAAPASGSCRLSLYLVPAIFDGNANGIPDECEIPPQLVIKPGGCPNTINPESRGVLPAALVGTPTFDVRQVDLESLVLARSDGVGEPVGPLTGQSGRRGGDRGTARGPKIAIEDVAGPAKQNDCECHDVGPDGIDDLVLKFDAEELAAALELDSPKTPAQVKLTIQGRTLDGGPFESADCIQRVGGRPPPGVRSAP